MAKQRYQDPKILTRTDVGRPFYYMLAAVPIVTPEGIKRKRQFFQLGFCDEVTMKVAKARKQQILAPINARRCLIQSQIQFRELARKFEGVRGIIFGEMLDCLQSANQGYTLQDVVLRVAGELGVPVAYGVRSGHVTGKNITLPIGVRAGITVGGGKIRMEILEAAVEADRRG